MKETNVNQTTIADFGKTISALHFSIDSTKKSIQEELDDHRVAIDLQTEDIEKVFVGLNEVDSKVEGVVEKLNARIDKLQMMLAQALMRSMLHVQLSKGEQYVFAVLEKSNVATSVLDVAQKTGLSDDAIFVACEKMVDKGIPLRKGSRDGRAYLFIESSFLESQRQHHMIHIDDTIEQKIGNQVLGTYFV